MPFIYLYNRGGCYPPHPEMPKEWGSASVARETSGGDFIPHTPLVPRGEPILMDGHIPHVILHITIHMGGSLAPMGESPVPLALCGSEGGGYGGRIPTHKVIQYKHYCFYCILLSFYY